MGIHRALAVFATAALPLLPGCTTLFWETGLPWTSATFRVERLTARGPYLDVEVASDGIERRFFTPASEACRSVLRAEQTVTKGSGLAGPFRRGDQECPVIGIGNLEDFRSSRSRGGYGQSPIQRANERLEIVHRDESYFYARGGFSVAAMFGWAPGTDQVVGLLPRIPACEPLASGGFVSILYREAGSPALGIPVDDALCPVHGVIATEPGQFDGFGSAPDAS